MSAKPTKPRKCRARTMEAPAKIKEPSLFWTAGLLCEPPMDKWFIAPATNNGLPELRAFCATLSEEAKDTIFATILSRAVGSRYGDKFQPLKESKTLARLIGIKPKARK